MNTIHDFHAQGKTVQEIARTLDISRTTVRKYLKHPEAVIRKPRPPRPSKLDPFKEQITKWVTEDHCTNCEVMLVRLQKLGYVGAISILKEDVASAASCGGGPRASPALCAPWPGEQVQFDWESLCTKTKEWLINSLEMEDNKPRWNPRKALLHGLHRCRRTRLQAVSILLAK